MGTETIGSGLHVRGLVSFAKAGTLAACIAFATTAAQAAPTADKTCPRVDVSPDVFELVERWLQDYDTYLNADLESLINDAKAGDTRSQAAAGWRLLHSKSDEKSIDEAVAFLASAKSKNEPLALYASGTLEREGRYLAQDLAEAHKDFQRSADAGFVASKSSVAADFMIGSGVQIDFTKAREYAQSAFDDGYAAAGQKLGLIYGKGLGVNVDLEKAFAYSKKAAQIGDPLAEFDLARAFYFGEGTPRDIDAAYRFAKRAYCSGLKQAGLLLGKIELSKHTTEGADSAVGFLEDVANSGQSSDADAALVLSDIFLTATYQRQDLDKAFFYLSLASRLGLPEAKYRYGAALLRYGRNVEERALAEKPLIESAQSGNAQAQYDLGIAYWRGTELRLDIEKSKSWLTRAMQNGNANAAGALEQMEKENRN